MLLLRILARLLRLPPRRNKFAARVCQFHVETFEQNLVAFLGVVVVVVVVAGARLQVLFGVDLELNCTDTNCAKLKRLCFRLEFATLESLLLSRRKQHANATRDLLA